MRGRRNGDNRMKGGGIWRTFFGVEGGIGIMRVRKHAD
jgi:hypothetical protein